MMSKHRKLSENTVLKRSGGSGVAKSLLLGAKRERSEHIWGSVSLPQEKLLGTTPLRCLENEGNALFSYILHHKHDYIEYKIGRMFCLIWIKNFCSRSILIFEELSSFHYFIIVLSVYSIVCKNLLQKKLFFSIQILQIII